MPCPVEKPKTSNIQERKGIFMVVADEVEDK